MRKIKDCYKFTKDRSKVGSFSIWGNMNYIDLTYSYDRFPLTINCSLKNGKSSLDFWEHKLSERKDIVERINP